MEICRDRSDVSSSSVVLQRRSQTLRCVYLVFLEQLFDPDLRQVRCIVRRGRFNSLTVILKLHVSRGRCAWSILLYESQRVLHTQTHHRSNLCASNLLRTAHEWEITYQISSVVSPKQKRSNGNLFLVRLLESFSQSFRRVSICAEFKRHQSLP